MNAAEERALLDATRAFSGERQGESLWAVLSTLALLFGTTLVAVLPARDTSPLVLGARVLACALSGLLIVRTFILYHDHFHGALLPRSRWARALFTFFGFCVLTPPRVWCDTHNYHHAHTAKIVGSHVGSYALVTKAMWARMSRRERRAYAIVRHPLTVLLGYFTIFGFGMCLSPLMRSPQRNWTAAAALVVHVAIGAAIGWFFGPLALLLGWVLPIAIAMAMGAYLFYAQHNFPDAHIQPREAWSFTRAALESSSYMEMGPVMNFFTGNIGYHHVHHLNPKIPFYRLPEAMSAIPELQQPGRTTFTWHAIRECFSLKLWDPETGRMTTYPTEPEGSKANAEPEAA